MLGTAGGAQGGHGVGEAQLRERDHVHVALNHQRITLLTQAQARLEQAVQLFAFAEHRRLGRVQIFGLAFVEHASAKTNHFALHRADGKHDAVTEAVVALAVFLADAVFVGRDHQARLLQQRVVVFGEGAGQRAPTVGGVTQAVNRGNFTAEAACLQIVNRARRDFELLAVVVVGLRQGLTQGGLTGFFGGGQRPFFWRAVIFGHGHSGLLRQVAHRIGKADTQVFHQEADRVAVHTATKAVVSLARGADHEAGRLFAVEWTQAFVVDAGFFQLDVTANNVNDVNAREQVLNEAGGDHGTSLAVG